MCFSMEKKDCIMCKDWKSALREADAVIANGVDSSQLVTFLAL